MPLTLSPFDIAERLLDAGFDGWQVVTGGAVVAAESGRDFYAVHVVDREFRADGAPNPAFRSLDVGGGQINTYWWPQFAIRDLLDPAGNAAAMRYIWLDRFDSRLTDTWAMRTAYAWSAWAVYESGAHEQYLSAAVDAAREAGAVD